MRGIIRTLVVTVGLLLSLSAFDASAAPIITFYTSPALLQAGNPTMVILADEEFGDTMLDSGIAISPSGSFGGSPITWYTTTGPVTYTLTSGQAAGLWLSFFNLPVGQQAPMVSILLAGSGAWYNIGGLAGTQDSTTSATSFFSFTSSEPFTSVGIAMGGSQNLSTDAVGFVGTVPEPATLVLLSAGLVVSAARRALRRRSR